MTTPPEGQQPPGPDADRQGVPADPYGAPPAGPYGTPGAGPYAAPPAGPYGAPPAGPYGAPPAGPYGAPAAPYGGPVQRDPYGPAGTGGAVPTQQDPPTDVVSVVGLVLAFLLAPVGLVLSIIGLSRTAGGRRKGRGLAVAGVVVSVVMSLLLAAAVVALVALGNFLVDEAGTTIEGFEDAFPTAEPFPTTDPFLTTEPFPTGDPSAPASLAPLPEGSTADPAALLGLGEAAELDGLRLTVTAVDLEADAAVAAESADNPPPTGRYVLVSGTVENTSAEARDVYLGLNVAYASAAGSVHDEFSCGAVVAGAPADLPELAPGEQVDARWCLDVPVDEVGGGSVVVGTNQGSATAAWADR